jgi:hypothetical protein
VKFQVTIPPLTEDDFQMNVTVEGANWRTALRAALKKIGESAELVKNIECDVQDDGSFKITDIDTRRIFTIKEIAEAAGAADAQKQEEAKRAAEEKRKQEEEAEKRRSLEAEEARRTELKREEDKRREEEARRQEEQRLLREQTVREEEQASQRKAAAEAKRLEEEQQKQRDEEGRRKLEDERQREEQKRREDAQRTALEEQRKLEDQRKKDDAKKQQEEEQRKKEAAQKAEEQKKRDAAKASETQKLSRPKSKGETIETRLGQKIGGTDTVEFLSDAFDALGELFSITTPQKAVDFILEQAMRKAPSEAGSVFFNDVGKRQVSFWSTKGPKSEKLLGKSLPYGKGIVGYCISKSVSLAIPDVSQDPRWDPAISESIAFETRSVLCAPLYYEGRCYGALELLNRKSDSGFTRRELSVVNYLAEQLARWLHENGE